MNRKGAEAIFEILIIIGSIFALSYLMSEGFSGGIVSAQAPPGIGEQGTEDEEIPQSWQDAFPGYSDEQINQLREDFGENIDGAISFRNEAQTNGYESGTELNQELENALESGQVSDSLVNILQFLNNFIPQFTSLSSFFGGGFSGFGNGVYVCPLDDNNAICQAYLADECAANCQEECIKIDISKAPLPEDSECAIGICYVAEGGLCSGGTNGGGAPKRACGEELGGTWYPMESQEAAQLCQKGCCMLGDQPIFATEGQCLKEINSFGGDVGSEDFRFDASLNDELACLGSLAPPEEGACTFVSFDQPDKNDCKFVTKDECVEIGGNFHSNLLCSNPELNTVCERQSVANCAEEKEEVYWFDSCGNRENIYDADTARSWNGGIVLPKEESCVLGDDGNPIANQASCGNCARIASSFCGEKTDGDEFTPKQEIPGQEVVCRDMGCYEKDFLGNLARTRDHDESWCAYQSSIGLPGNDNMNPLALVSFLPENPLTNLLGGGAGDLHSTDTPGSTHFRRYCQNGEIKTAPCDTFRGEVCVESQTPIGLEIADPALLATNSEEYFKQLDESIKNIGNVDFLNTFSQASCRVNRWAECFAYNPDVFESRLIGMAGNKAGDLLKLKLDTTCGMDPDCFVKTVDLTSGDDDTFKFSYCAPRYPPGFDYGSEEGAAETGENFCMQGSSVCTAVFVKEAVAGGFGGAKWECKANCDCVEGEEPDSAKPSEEFINQMNSLCVSLGDCGSQVNYLGSAPGGKGYKACTGEEGKCEGLGGLGDIGSGVGSLFGFGGNNFAGDANPTPGEYVPAASNNFLGDFLGNSVDKFLGDLGLDGLIDQFEGGIGEDAGVPSPDLGVDTGGAYALAGISGAMGAGVIATQYISTGLVSSNVLSTNLAGAWPAAGGFAGAALGAAAGVAITALLIDALGIGAGLDPVTAYTTIGVGGVGAGIVGYQLATEAGWAAVSANPVGIIMVAAVVAYTIFLKVLGVGEVEEVDVIFECQKWVPPQGGNCEACGEDGLSDGSSKFPCNKYSCETIGQNCEFVENSEEPERGGLCIEKADIDVFPPKVVNVIEESLTEGFRYENFEFNKKVEIIEEEMECMSQYDLLTFGIELDEPGRCRMSAVPPTNLEQFDLMRSVGGSLGKNHTISLRGLDLDELGLDAELIQEQRNDVSLYIVCEDYHEKSNPLAPFVVEVCVVPQDFQPVRFPSSSTITNVAPYDAESYDFSININEPAECRWNLNNVPFGQMSSENSCDAVRNGFGGYSCNFNDIPLIGESTGICVKCLDHPEWEGTEREEDRNENVDCMDVEILRSESELVGELISPTYGENLKRGSSPAVVELIAETSGGANSGEASCSYTINGFDLGLMRETGGTTHRQVLDQTIEGNHEGSIYCSDGVNPEVEIDFSFSVEIDVRAPRANRIYEESGSLFLATDEGAQCAYTFAPVDGRNFACDFRVEEAGVLEGVNLMSVVSGSGGLRHQTGFENGKTYYMKCSDEFENQNLGCEIIASAGTFN